MTRNKPAVLRILKRSKPLFVGFMPEADCAPLVVAQELGLYRKYGLTVELRREQSWRNIQDKIISRQLQAAHAPATLPFLINLGLAPEKCACVTGLVLSLQGDTITISRDLWNRGVTDAESLGRYIMRDKRIYTFGVNCPLGPQYWLLCQWLRSAEIPYHVKVRIEPAAATQMFPLLKMGYLDGYCVGEPWSSLAVQAGVGVCVATSAQLAPSHPEKVLLVRRDFAEQRGEEHERLIAALIEACAFCDQPENRSQLCDLLALPQYVNVPVECLDAGLLDPGRLGSGPLASGSSIFHRNRANDPTSEKAAWVTGKLYEFLRWTARPAAVNNVFQRSIFLRALAMTTRRRSSPTSRLNVADKKTCCAR